MGSKLNITNLQFAKQYETNLGKLEKNDLQL